LGGDEPRCLAAVAAPPCCEIRCRRCCSSCPSAGTKEGGQALLGGLDCTVQRNYFGAQINSFETLLPAPACLPRNSDPADTFRAVFIRAPAITETGSGELRSGLQGH
jgi:glutamine amidotransferase PdxT